GPELNRRKPPAVPLSRLVRLVPYGFFVRRSRRGCGMRVVKSVPVEEILCRGSIRDSDVAKLALAYRSDRHLTAEDADTLFLMTQSCPVQAPAWSDFFIEALGDYLLSDMAPEGYVTADKASWL